MFTRSCTRRGNAFFSHDIVFIQFIIMMMMIFLAMIVVAVVVDSSVAIGHFPEAGFHLDVR